MGFKETQLEELETEMTLANFWDDQTRANQTIKKANLLKSWLEPFKDLKTRCADVKALIKEALEAQDIAFLAELNAELVAIDKEIGDLETRKMLSGEMDQSNCFLSVNSGAGGTEACDWAQMLLRMYERWAARRNWKVEVIDVIEDDVAGIKSATIKIVGEFAYGYAKAEKGVHRLVRISPFDSNARRHTSFAAVDVTPEVSDDIEIEIRTEDIRVDTYRASGAGGQHVNKTDSAVRMTHGPSGIVVSCQSQRSQIQNRESCLKMLKSKLYEKELLERQKKIDEKAEEKKKIEWGSQIRSYTFQPYTLVKDVRTKFESGNVQAVMDGEIDDFIQAYLKDFGV
ncbi:MAG: peptide chain release factor 2 [Chlamydiales bacterium]|nr:peptide chain release factor 2 [Chlamydiales bacterium]